MAHVTQSRPHSGLASESGLDFQGKSLKTFQVVPSSFGSGNRVAGGTWRGSMRAAANTESQANRVTDWKWGSYAYGFACGRPYGLRAFFL